MNENPQMPGIIRYPLLARMPLEEFTKSIMLFQPFHGHNAYAADDRAVSVIHEFNKERKSFAVQSLISTIHSEFSQGMSEKEYLRTTNRTHQRLFEYKFGIPIYYFPKIEEKSHSGTTRTEFVLGLQKMNFSGHPVVVVMEPGFRYSEFIEVFIEEIAPEIEICQTLEIGVKAACLLSSRIGPSVREA